MKRAIGFRNSMIQDYMNFDENVLINLLLENRYKKIVDFLKMEVSSGETIKNRIKSFTF